MNQLSVQERRVYQKLKEVTNEGAWGQAIKMVISEGDQNKFRLLITQLKSQAKDCADTMKKILGNAYDSVISL